MTPPDRDALADTRESARRATSLRHGLILVATVLLVAATVAAAHWPVLRAQARSLDDNQFLTYNPLVTHPGWTSTWRFCREVLHPSTVKGYYLPLTMTSLMVDYALGGRPDDLRVFHRTSLALHVLNAGLILLLLYRLFGALVPAAIAALLFGLHPLTVEPTAWIGERKTLLAAFFALSSLHCYVQRTGRKSPWWTVASIVLYGLALLSKPTVTMLPLLLLLLDYWPLRRLQVRTVVEKWPFYILSLLFGAITVISHHRTAGIATSTQTDFLLWPLQAAYLLTFYLEKIVWPANLSCVYQPPLPFAFLNPVVFLHVIAACVLSILLVVFRRARGPLTGWLFFALAMLPTLGLVKFSWVIASDKYVYFPALGILLVLGAGLAVAWDSPRLRGHAPKAILLSLVLLILAAEVRGSRITLRNWTDSLTLYRHMAEIAPDSPVVHSQLGVLLEGASAHEDAVRHLQRSLELMPEYGEAHYNLGIVLAGQGKVGEAIQHCRKAVELMPDDADAAYNLGMSLRLANELDEAAARFREALRLKPDYVDAMDQLGGVLVIQGRTEEAVEQLRKALGLAESNARLHFRLAAALVLLGGHASEVANHLRQAIRYQPDWPEPYNELAWRLATTPDPAARDPGEALRLAGRGVELTHHRDPNQLDTLAAAQAAAGQFGQAVQTARSALEALQPRSDALAQAIQGRLELYEQGTAYTEPDTASAKRPAASRVP